MSAEPVSSMSAAEATWALSSSRLDGAGARSFGSRRIAALLYRFCAPHRRAFLVIALLAAVSSVADVAAPLIYRTAINDLTGVFVHRAHHEAAPGRPQALTSEPHRAGRVAPRTAPQAVRSLLTAVGAL